jgi:plastocyanin
VSGCRSSLCSSFDRQHLQMMSMVRQALSTRLLPSTVENEITVHTITVGEKQHYFTPNSINALPGDIVTFKFWPGNHSVIRAEFGYPCVPYQELRDSDSPGFYSGVQSPDAIDVVRETVGANTGLASQPNLKVSAASHMEPDDQHHLSGVLLLWRTRQLCRLGHGRRNQRRRESPYRNANRTRQGMRLHWSPHRGS